jgi:hypothetical protein
MRYFIIRYLQRANGQFDEVSEIAKKIKLSHRQTAGVILDFRNLQVLQAYVNGVAAPRDWDVMMQTYMPHYKQQFKMLLNHNHGPDPTETAQESAAVSQ